MKDIKIEYDGEYPSLCFGNLFVTVDGTRWKFKNVLRSGGSIFFKDSGEEVVKAGPWKIHKDDWPEGFPESLKGCTMNAINDQVKHGCCGGCV